MRSLTALAVATLIGPVSAVGQQRGEAFAAPSIGQLRTPSVKNTAGGFVLGFGFGSRAVVFGPEFVWATGDSLRLRAIAITVRVRQVGGRLHPHLVAGLGAYAWQSRLPTAIPEVDVVGPVDWSEISYLSGSIGAGVTYGRVDRGPSLLLEGRWHRNITQDAVAGSRALLQIDAGIRVVW